MLYLWYILTSRRMPSAGRRTTGREKVASPLVARGNAASCKASDAGAAKEKLAGSRSRSTALHGVLLREIMISCLEG